MSGLRCAAWLAALAWPPEQSVAESRVILSSVRYTALLYTAYRYEYIQIMYVLYVSYHTSTWVLYCIVPDVLYCTVQYSSDIKPTRQCRASMSHLVFKCFACDVFRKGMPCLGRQRKSRIHQISRNRSGTKIDLAPSAHPST